MKLYNPTCPHCGSTNTRALRQSVRDQLNAVVAIAAVALSSLPIKSVKAKCDDCGRTFKARGSQSFPLEAKGSDPEQEELPNREAHRMAHP